MVAYLTDARCWLQRKEQRSYASWKDKNFFFSLTHDCMHDCIRNSTRKWDPALMTSTVWPTFRQGIISMLSGGKVGQLQEPDPRRREKAETKCLCLKVLLPCFPLSPYFGSDGLIVFCFLMERPPFIRGPSKYRLCLGLDLLRLSLTISWQLI